MAFVSLFNVITQDTWPADPPHSLHMAGGHRVLLEARQLTSLKWGKKRGHTGLFRHHQSCVGKGQGCEVPWATYLTPHITDGAPGAQKAKGFPCRTDSILKSRCPDSWPPLILLDHPHRSSGKGTGLGAGGVVPSSPPSLREY